MVDIQLSPNFKLSEFTKNDVNDVQLYLIKSLSIDILQPIRNFLKCSITITSALRDLSDFYRLKDQGYNPSSTSDHFYGIAVPVIDTNKRNIFGDTYNFSVGAADLVPNCDVRQAFDLLIKECIRIDYNSYSFKFLKPDTKFGQMIYEKNSKSEWIHISNHSSIMYNNYVIDRYLKRPSILQSIDNGKTYSKIIV
jgi:hypothetical protein